MPSNQTPLDVWLRFESPDDEEPTYEANTFQDEEGGFNVEWYHTAVGLVQVEGFKTLAMAHDWLTQNGYSDFTA